MMRVSYLARVVSGREKGAAASALSVPLTVAGAVYGGLMRVRAGAYGMGVLPSVTLGRPTVAVGNLTTGGTGKTPFVRMVVEELRRAGCEPAVLLRGYGRADARELGDEGKMLAAMTGAVVVAGADRVLSAKRVLAERTDIGAFVLDDGFQHQRVKRDLNVLLVSAGAPWGRADHVMRCLPGGLMREPLAAARRADVVVITRADQFPPERAEEITAVMRKVGVCAPIFRGAHQVIGLRSADRGAGESCDLPVSWVKGKRVAAVCGIGEPGSFVAQLQALGAEVVRVFERPDHHAYVAADVAEISAAVAAAGADGTVTTEKDWVKLAGLPLPTRAAWVRVDVKMALLSDSATAFREMLLARVRVDGQARF